MWAKSVSKLFSKSLSKSFSDDSPSEEIELGGVAEYGLEGMAKLEGVAEMEGVAELEGVAKFELDGMDEFK